jgi:hypothetical protein
VNALPEETLDPDDRGAALELTHRIVADSVRDVRVSDLARHARAGEGFLRHAAAAPTKPLSEIYREIAEKVAPYPMGNVHPRFWSLSRGKLSRAGGGVHPKGRPKRKL